MENKLNKSKTSYLSNNTNDITYTYSFYDYIDIQLGDPISSIALNNKYIIIGTMMGQIKLFCLNSEYDKIFILNKENPEHITGISILEDEHTIYASIGDEKIISFETKDKLINNMISNKMDIYDNPLEHNIYCENAYILMSIDSLIKIYLLNFELEEKIKDDIYIFYEILYFSKNSSNYKSKKKGKIKTTNYFIPLDFDGSNLCWVEYLNDKQDRNLCVQYITKDGLIDNIDNIIYKFKVDKSYGHISHAKLLNENIILIVHELNKCEIRNIEKNFELINSFTHIGDEIYAIDFIYHDNNINYSEDLMDYKTNNINIDIKNKFYESYTNNENIIKINKEKKTNESQNLKGNKLPKIEYRNKKLKIGNSSELNTDSLKLFKDNNKKKKNNKLNQILAIITLDIDGNVNKYENGIEEVLFNLYDIKGIYKDHKDKKFFNMGYVYFIKTNLNYFGITTDHGCYIIKRND